MRSREHLHAHGWELLTAVYSATQLQTLLESTAVLAETEDEAVRGKQGAVYAARNVLDLCPQIVQQWQTPELVELLKQVLGPEVGLVRALYFDKPPEQTWALPWHKDLLIAVQSDVQVEGFSRPRLRAGVWHTEPPLPVLESMLTLRVHLDPMTEHNGPLEVLSGTQRTGKQLLCTGYQHARILSSAGDVFAMRPLLVHASGRSDPDTQEHRRVLHLEFSGLPQLPGGHQWHGFYPIQT